MCTFKFGKDPHIHDWHIPDIFLCLSGEFHHFLFLVLSVFLSWDLFLYSLTMLVLHHVCHLILFCHTHVPCSKSLIFLSPPAKNRHNSITHIWPRGYKTWVQSQIQNSAMIGCLRTRVRKQPIIALYFEFENVTSWPVMLHYSLNRGNYLRPSFHNTEIIFHLSFHCLPKYAFRSHKYTLMTW